MNPGNVATMQDHPAPSPENTRTRLMAMFLTPTSDLPEFLTNPTSPIDLNVIVDDQGHTSMHWAATLSRLEVLEKLIQHGADPRRGNWNGESPLMRSVMDSHAYTNSSFGYLLTQLGPTVDVTDHKGRTVLHHIALAQGKAAVYYLSCLLEYLAQKFPDLLKQAIDKQDRHGDTALCIACRGGEEMVVKGLVDAGADPQIANHVGLKPVDFGIGRVPDNSVTNIGTNMTNLSNFTRNNLASALETASQDIIQSPNLPKAESVRSSSSQPPSANLRKRSISEAVDVPSKKARLARQPLDLASSETRVLFPSLKTEGEKVRRDHADLLGRSQRLRGMQNTVNDLLDREMKNSHGTSNESTHDGEPTQTQSSFDSLAASFASNGSQPKFRSTILIHAVQALLDELDLEFTQELETRTGAMLDIQRQIQDATKRLREMRESREKAKKNDAVEMTIRRLNLTANCVKASNAEDVSQEWNALLKDIGLVDDSKAWKSPPDKESPTEGCSGQQQPNGDATEHGHTQANKVENSRTDHARQGSSMADIDDRPKDSKADVSKMFSLLKAMESSNHVLFTVNSGIRPLTDPFFKFEVAFKRIVTRLTRIPLDIVDSKVEKLIQALEQERGVPTDARLEGFVKRVRGDASEGRSKAVNGFSLPKENGLLPPIDDLAHTITAVALQENGSSIGGMNDGSLAALPDAMIDDRRQVTESQQTLAGATLASAKH